jgi:hypothetical protein
MIAIREAKLFIITSLVIDNWIDDLSSVGGQDTIVLHLSSMSFTQIMITIMNMMNTMIMNIKMNTMNMMNIDER